MYTTSDVQLGPALSAYIHKSESDYLTLYIIVVHVLVWQGDKRSIVGDAILYLKNLQNTNKTLNEQNRELEHRNEELRKALLVFQESKEEEPVSSVYVWQIPFDVQLQIQSVTWRFQKQKWMSTDINIIF